MQQQPDSERAKLPPAAQLSHLLDGYVYTQLIAIAVRLGIPDLLAAGARTPEALAVEVGIDAERLRRVLRGLASVGVLEESENDAFALTDVGALLQRDVQGSLAGPALVRGTIYFPAAMELYRALTEGGIAFERAFGTELFSYLQQTTEAGEIFQASMSARSRVEAEAMVRAVDLSLYETIVDIGGGTGVLLERVLRAAPRSRGVLFDLPAVVERARDRLAGSEIANRMMFVEGDFFQAVTPGGDLYLLSRVIHDWDDERAGVILRAVRGAMAASGTLMLVEAVAPERAADQPSVISMDLHMLMILGGRERTAAEFAKLLTESGFELAAIQQTDSPTGASIIQARPD
jgi:ubiquinone/menaquinone biosynthesis C-methylase UbiE